MESHLLRQNDARGDGSDDGGRLVLDIRRLEGRFSLQDTSVFELLFVATTTISHHVSLNFEFPRVLELSFLKG